MAANIETYGELFSSPTITPEIQKALKKTQAYAKLRLQTRTPVDTGRLRRSWEVTPAAQGLAITNEAPYAGFVELGTRRMRARPMLAPTIPEAQDYFAEQLANELARKLSSQVKANLGSRARASTQVAQAQQQRSRATAKASSMISRKSTNLGYETLKAGVPKPLPTPKRKKRR